MTNKDYLEKLEKLKPLDTQQRLTLLYEWTVDRHIGLRAFRLLSKWIEDHRWN